MASFLDALDGSSKRALMTWWSTWESNKLKKAREQQRLKESQLKDLAKRYQKLGEFYFKNPGISKLHMLYMQNPDAFKKDYPEYAHLANVDPALNPEIENLYLRGNPLEVKRFEAMRVAPWAERAKNLVDLRAKYGPEGVAKYGHLYGDDTAASLDNYAGDMQNINANAGNHIAHAVAKEKAQTDYASQLRDYPDLLKPMDDPNYIFNKDQIDTTIGQQAKMIEQIRAARHYGTDNKMTQPLKSMSDELENVLNKSFSDPSVLSDPTIKGRYTDISNSMLQTQQNVGRVVNSLAPKGGKEGFTPESDPENFRAFREILARGGRAPNDEEARRLYAQYGSAISRYWPTQATNVKDAGQMLSAFGETRPNDPDWASKQRMQRTYFMSKILENHTDFFDNMPPADPGAYDQFKQERKKSDDDYDAGVANVFRPPDSPPGGSMNIDNTPAQSTQDEQPQQAPTSPNPILGALWNKGLRVMSDGKVYTKDPSSMPGETPRIKELGPEEYVPLIEAFLTQRGIPQMVDMALDTIDEMSLGTAPEKYFSLIPAAYRGFVRSAKQAADDPEKLKALYSQFGSYAPNVEKMGNALQDAFKNNMQPDQIFQQMQQSFGIPVPPKAAMPQEGQQADPRMAAVGDEKVKQEQLKTQALQQKIETEKHEREAKEKLEAEKEQHERQLEQQKAQFEQKAQADELSLKQQDLQMRGSEMQTNQQMHAQQMQQQQQLAQSKQEAQMAAEQQKQQMAAEQQKAQQEMQQQQQAQQGADPYQEGMGNALLGIQRTSPHAQEAAIKWDAQRGTHVGSAISGDDPQKRRLEFDMDEPTMKQYGMQPQHIEAMRRGPPQQVQQQAPQQRQTKILGPGAVQPKKKEEPNAIQS